MEDSDYQENGYQRITETLFQTFEQKLSKDVIAAIVESCGGDLNESANAIINMIDDTNIQDNKKTQELPHEMEDTGRDPDPAHPEAIPQSYAGASARPAAKPSTFRSSPKRSTKTKYGQYDTHQIQNILSQHNKGNRILIIMRGLPGSGKSYLAKKIMEMIFESNTCDFKKHILSTDDYFMRGNEYHFEKSKLHISHEWNQNRAKDAMIAGLSPIIIDNTNIAPWELEPYVRNGVQYGYLIEVLESNTPWAKKVQQLDKKNIHNIPIQTIRRMFNNYEDGIDANYIMKAYNLSYPPDMLPPVLRNIPAVQLETQPIQTVSEELIEINFSKEVKSLNLHTDNTIPSSSKNENNDEVFLNDNEIDQNRDIACKEPFVESKVDANLEAVMENRMLEQYSEIERQYQEFAKVEQDWDQGESWDNDSQTTTLKSAEDDHEKKAKPQRIFKNQELKADFSNSKEQKTDNSNFVLKEPSELIPKKIEFNDAVSDTATCSNVSNNPCLGDSKPEIESKELIPKVDNFLAECQDWTKISMFMPPWENESKSDDSKPTIVVEKVDSSTCVEIDDTNINNTDKPYKLLPATARDINPFYVSVDKEKIPEKRMLDKSSMTNEQILTESSRCKYEERHFKTFRKMFKNIKKANLREILDRCCGDVNWAVNIVLEDMANKQLSVLDNEDSSASDDEITEQCDCWAAYDIIPDNSPAPSPNTNSDSTEEIVSEGTPQKQRKSKKHASVSETSVKMKRQLEENVVIPDNHYSEYFLKVRNTRRGGSNKVKNEDDNAKKAVKEDDAIPSTSKAYIEASSSASEIQATIAQIEVADEFTEHDEETHVNFDLGKDFVAHLDEYFERRGFQYPSGIQTKINIPTSLLKQINALWMESFLDQLDQSSKQTELMIKQDEEFARQLALKEAEMAQAGKEPEVPDLKEIMDMEFALSLYQKDVQEEWRNKEPNDLAAKLSKDKLFQLFPDVSRDVLSELLMAHDNNFYETIEGLLLSTGLGEVLESKDGVNKYVMKKELERHEKIIQAQKKALAELEWPLLPKSKTVDISLVNNYRKEADMHAKRRSIIFQKAQEYMNRGMTQVATYYSELADLHKRKFEYANCLAAAYLIQVHALNSPDDSYVDLHFLRVAEALQSVDLFLDMHIRRLRDNQGRPNMRCRMLFIVTGRGIHSAHGLPRIKPATQRRLTERRIAFREVNPGLLTARVCAEDLLSDQVA